MAPIPSRRGIPSPSPTPKPISVPDEDAAGEDEVAALELVVVTTDPVVDAGKFVVGDRL